MGLKECSDCSVPKLVPEFTRRPFSKSPEYEYARCNECHRKKQIKRRSALVKKNRSKGCGGPWASIVRSNCRTGDKAAGRFFFLDLEFVRLELQKPCSYCGRTVDFMSLDRIDNSIGHIEQNVVACCRLCNYIRGAMPIEAWKIVSPFVNQANDRGLFKGWDGRRKC